MDDSRTVALLGANAAAKLKDSAVAVFGVGGVGSFAAEALARAGVGTLILVDNDVVKPSNCNRQLVALSSTIGKKKVGVMKERIPVSYTHLVALVNDGPVTILLDSRKEF